MKVIAVRFSSIKNPESPPASPEGEADGGQAASSITPHTRILTSKQDTVK